MSPALALALVASLLAGAPQGKGAETERLLARARSALHLAADDPVVETSGRLLGDGVSTPFAWILGPDGSFLLERKGDLPSRTSFDGAVFRRSDGEGFTWSPGGLEAERLKLLAAVWGGSWARPRSPLLREAGTEPSTVELRVPGGRLEGLLRLDEATGRPAELLLTGPGLEERYRIEGHLAPDRGPLQGGAAADGPLFPARVLSGSGSGSNPASLEVHEVQDARIWRGSASPFRGLRPTPPRQRLVPDLPATIPARGKDGTLLIEAHLGEEPVLLSFDPACTRLALGPAALRRLELPEVPGAPRLASRAPLMIGPLERAYPLVERRASDGTAPGSAEGAIGWELLAAGCLEVGVAPPRLELHAAGGPAGSGRLTWLPVELDGRVPVLRHTSQDGTVIRLAIAAPGGPSGLAAGASPMARLALGGLSLELGALAAGAAPPPPGADGWLALDALGPRVLLEVLGRGVGLPAPDSAPR